MAKSKRATARAAWRRFQEWFARGAKGEDTFEQFDNIELARAAFSLGLEEGLKAALARIDVARREVYDLTQPED